MKKILAILLALMMASSVALVSCDNSSSTDDEGPADFDGAFADDEEDEGDGSDEVDAEEDEDDKNSNKTNSGLSQINDTVYTLCKSNIRSSMKTSSDSNIIATAPFGVSLARTEAGEEWSKVTYEGKTGYIKTELITTSVDTITFVDPEGVKTAEDGAKTYPTTTVVGTKEDNYQLRKNPVVDSQGLPIEGQLKGGSEVKILAVSKDHKWAKVESSKVGKLGTDGKYPATEAGYNENGTGYILYKNLVAGAGSANSGDNGEVAGG